MKNSENLKTSKEILKIVNRKHSTQAEICFKIGDSVTLWKLSKLLKMLIEGNYIRLNQHGKYYITPEGRHAIRGDWGWNLEEAFRHFSYED